MSETTQATIQRAEDMLSFSRPIWNAAQGTQCDSINLRDPEQNVLASYDYVPEPLTAGGEKTRFSILKTTDTGQIVGVPFDSRTYKVLDNAGFIAVIEKICNALSGMGIKYSIAVTGTLRHRGRVFISLELGEMSEFKVGGRQFFAFLNCLNSVDKSCSVTFANNTFCVCCANTFAKALKPEDGAELHAKVKHTDGMAQALEDMPLIVEAWQTGNDAIFGRLQAFDSIGVTVAQAEAAFAAFLAGKDTGAILKTRSLNMVERIKELFVRGKGNKGETLLDLFSAATEYYSHESAGDTEDPWKQVETSELGDGSKRKVRFFELLSEMADKSSTFNGVAKVGDKILIASRKAQQEKAAAKGN